jgi:acetylglutamate kinase
VKVLIKLGGTLLDERQSLAAIARQLAAVASEHELVVVHGGGKQVTRYLAERGVPSRFIGGLRVSDATVIDAVTQVIAGSVNKQLVAATIAAGRPAVGISGVDGSLTSAVALSPELEFVGRPVHTDGRLLDLLLSSGYTPVIACLAGDDDGNIYNVNADAMAVSCAVGWKASRLLFLTDVGGVKDASGHIVPSLTSAAVTQLIQSGVAHGGMQAKLEAAKLAVVAGMQVDIVSGAEPDVAPRLLQGESVGTEWAAEGITA